MSQTQIMQDGNVVKRKPTLVRRVSNMLMDANYSGPPMLFRHASMQRIRHCCQNLNLLPYLLYSFDNSKPHIAHKVHSCIRCFVYDAAISISVAYQTLLPFASRGIKTEEAKAPETRTVANGGIAKVLDKYKFERSKRKRQHPFGLVATMHLIPILLVLQITFLCTLMTYGKYAPGFIFLTIALLFLGVIALKIISHQTSKYDNKCIMKKVQ